MEIIIAIIIIYGIFAIIGAFFSWVGKINEKRKEDIRNQVIENFQKNFDIKSEIEKYKNKLKKIDFQKAPTAVENYINKYAEEKNVKTIGEFGKFLSRCPSCEDGKLIGRKGPHGSFIGCSKFPKCRYTENVKTAKKEYKEEETKLLKLKEEINQLAKERQMGFPWLAKAYDDFFNLQDKQMVDFLKYKRQPAIKVSEVVKEYSRLKRAAEKEKRIAQYLVHYYESVAPFLIDLKEEVDLGTEEDKKIFEEFSDEERDDETTNYLTKEEYRKLPSVERNQMALDRFWKRPKSKWLIGRLYERYVGYLFEKEGYDVEYVGIFKGFEDLGRDLICKKGKNITIIQCKNWSKFRTIYEKHIFQFFGTVFQYRDENPKHNVKAIFYTTTSLSDLARRFAKELNTQLEENHHFNIEYPAIKCNIGRTSGEKIYHLPFDQQYDKTKIEPHKGEFYCQTVKEAEDAGFRRAFRYRQNKK